MLQTDRFPEDTIIIEEAVIPAAVFEAAADTGKFSIINSSSSDVAWSEDSSSVPKSCLQSKLSHSKKKPVESAFHAHEKARPISYFQIGNMK